MSGSKTDGKTAATFDILAVNLGQANRFGSV